MKFTFRKKDILQILSRVQKRADEDRRLPNKDYKFSQGFLGRMVGGGSSTACESSENKTSEGSDASPSDDGSGDGGDSDDDPDGDPDSPQALFPPTLYFSPQINIRIKRIPCNKKKSYLEIIKEEVIRLPFIIIGGLIAAIFSVILGDLLGLK